MTKQVKNEETAAPTLIGAIDLTTIELDAPATAHGKYKYPEYVTALTAGKGYILPATVTKTKIGRVVSETNKALKKANATVKAAARKMKGTGQYVLVPVAL